MFGSSRLGVGRGVEYPISWKICFVQTLLNYDCSAQRRRMKYNYLTLCVPPKLLHLCIRLHGDAYQKTAFLIFTAVRVWSPIQEACWSRGCLRSYQKLIALPQNPAYLQTRASPRDSHCSWTRERLCELCLRKWETLCQLQKTTLVTFKQRFYC
jgi:hypothetical protein